MKRLAALLGFVATWSCSPPPSPLEAQLDVRAVMSGEADPRFARALEPREFDFPADHGPQPEFQTEWWYFTANLVDEAGDEFGCQLTFFRRATSFEAPRSESAWAARDVYMAHFALTDVAREQFAAFERFERGALELAGASAEPWKAWCGGWSAEGDLAPGGAVTLRASHGDASIELELEASLAPVLNGERGLSRKGSSPGAASYYYSLPRMRAEGVVELGGRKHRVRGRAWFDREWSTSALDEDQVGWDWFALRLGDAGELMLYAMRRKDGTRDETSSGTWIDADGRATHLERSDFEIEALETWTSSGSGARYPAKWRVRAPKLDADLEVAPLVADQELELAVRYWEGAVRVTGTVRGARVDERGYVELTGY